MSINEGVNVFRCVENDKTIMDLFPMKGRRIPVPESNRHGIALELPGDYCGPVTGFTGSRNLPDGTSIPVQAVFYLKPNARDPAAPRPARSHQHVCSPPHNFIEEADGTLSITPSISNLDSKGENDDGWHGHLTKGEWVRC